MLGARGEREQPADLHRAGALLAGAQQPLAVARVARTRAPPRGRRVPRLLSLGKRVERRAAEDHAVVLDDLEVADLVLQPLAAALDQRAIGFQRLDQREDAADVLDLRRRAAARTGSAVIMVPTPECVNSSSSVAPSARRETRCARPTPRAHARAARARWRAWSCAARPSLLEQRLGLARGQLASTAALAVRPAAGRRRAAACRRCSARATFSATSSQERLNTSPVGE